MHRFYYVNDFQMDPETNLLISLRGYYTNEDHTFGFPPELITRKEAIQKMKAGDILFIHDGCYRPIRVKPVLIDRKVYLRVDSHAIAQDYLG